MSDVPEGIPRSARWLVERVLRASDAEMLLGDLDESGAARGATRWWYWRQTIVALWILWGRGGSGVVAHHRLESLMATFLMDVRIAARGLRRTPGFASVMVVTLALGIGASAAMFSVLNPVLLRPLPYPEAYRLVMVWERERSNTSWSTVDDLSRLATSFEAVVPMTYGRNTMLDGASGDSE